MNTPNLDKLLAAASAVARRNHHNFVGPEHVLVALFEPEAQRGPVAELCRKRRWKSVDLNALFTKMFNQ